MLLKKQGIQREIIFHAFSAWYAEYCLRLQVSGQVAACLSHTRKTDTLNITGTYAGNMEESAIGEVRA